MDDDERAAKPEPEPPRPFTHRALIVIGLVTLVAVGLVIVGLAWATMLTLFGGVLIGVLLDAAAARISAVTRMPRKPALALALVLLLGAAAGMGSWLGPALSERFEGLQQQVSSAWESTRTWLEARSWGVRLREDVSELDLTSLLSPRFGGLLSTAAGTVASLSLVAVFGVYFAANPGLYVSGFSNLFPRRHRASVRALLGAIAQALRSWFLGRLLSMTVVGVGTALGLWIAGVPLAIPLGIIAGVLSFVPNLGPVMAAIPGVLVALAIDPTTALWALLVYAGVQVLETYAITPIIQQRVVSMPPALLLAFQILLGLSAGMIGLFMATPLLVSIVVVVQMVYVRHVLGDDILLIGENPRSETSDERSR